MATINSSYKNADSFGRPAFDVLDTYVQSNLSAGAEPPMQQPSRVLLGDSLTLAQFTVVGISGGKLVKAVYSTDPEVAVPAIGVLAHAVTSGASNTTVFGEVIPTGCFNIGETNAGTDSPLVWDASFDTMAKKRTATALPNLIFRTRGGL